MNRKLSQGEVLACLDQAIRENQFQVYYQPQYNHSTGALVGAEALLRWFHPECGYQAPMDYLPWLEESGDITRVDLYVFRKVCEMIAGSDRFIPISINVSRVDLMSDGFIDRLESIRGEYGVPPKYLRVEITESSVMGNVELIRDLVNRFHALGYVVEMDDFGSGYSSLNVLKDIEYDIIKLDMNFLAGNIGGRGGTILSSVVRMAEWLGTPTIAEGVETKAQADYMCSIGCDVMQGFLYSKAVPVEEFQKLVHDGTIGALQPTANLIETLDAHRFWSPESLETLIFNNYVGGAAIFLYKDGDIEMLRVNPKYIREVGMNLTEREMLKQDVRGNSDEANRKIYQQMLEKAIVSGEEEECETWRAYTSGCCGEERLCIRSSARLIGKINDQYLFHVMIRNITAEKRHFDEVNASDQRFRAASEQANVYAWEYNIQTKEMRPCFRCMRDLGLPPVVYNYPEPAIEKGIFPPDYADMYREWHRQLSAGAKSLEAIIPLTVGRVPFHVRYTTEFDEAGRPVKAYGSATLVVKS